MNLEDIEIRYNKLIVWGGGKYFNNCFTDDLKIDYIVDSDKNKQGSRCKGILIREPEKILDEDMGKICIIIFSMYWKDIVAQIVDMGITADVILPLMVEPNSFFRNCQNSYALFAEDAIINGISKRYNIAVEHYLDVGANHPVYGNATIMFYLNGSSGCLVEPNSKYISKIKKIRPRDVVYNVGLAGTSNDGKECKYYEIEGLDTRNTFSENVAEYYIQKGFSVHTKLVKLISINSLLEDYGQRVNYISIDVEGLEYEILKDFEFDRYGIEIFNIEKGDIRSKEVIEQHNYELVAETPSNWIFVIAGRVREVI